jgi:hypothetical protein
MSAQLMPRYTDYDQQLRQLAHEIVKNIRDASDVLAEFGLSEAQYAEIAETSTFKTMLRQAAAEWEAAGNTSERVRLKSATLIEQALPDLYKELTNRSEPLSSRVSLVQTLAKIAGLGQQAAAPQGKGNVFKLTINTSGHRSEPRTITIESNVIEPPALPDVNDELTAGIEEALDA